MTLPNAILLLSIVALIVAVMLFYVALLLKKLEGTSRGQMETLSEISTYLGGISEETETIRTILRKRESK
jgi:uncharacterized protein YoxC